MVGVVASVGLTRKLVGHCLGNWATALWLIALVLGKLQFLLFHGHLIHCHLLVLVYHHLHLLVSLCSCQCLLDLLIVAIVLEPSLEGLDSFLKLPESMQSHTLPLISFCPVRLELDTLFRILYSLIKLLEIMITGTPIAIDSVITWIL